MKFLFVAINSKYIHSNLAVYNLRAYAQKYGKNRHQIEIAEYTINQYADEILRDIYERGADAIGFSCYIWNISLVKELAADYKKISPKTEIWVGGPEVSYSIETFLTENKSIDYVMFGEGEKVFQNIMDAYECVPIDETALKALRGIAYRKEKVIVNSPESFVDLSDIPFIYNGLEKFENRIIYYESSRGCPFSCSYCLSCVDKTLRFRDLEMVKKELEFFMEHRVKQVKFVDRTFNCDPRRALAIWKFIQKNDNGITNFHFEIAADLMTDEQVEFLGTMRPGLIQFEIGVQSTNKKTLEAIHRKTDIAKIAKVTQKIRNNHNIHQHLDLIAGLPYENYESFANSFHEVYAMKPDQLQLGFLKILHGSDMEACAKEYGIIYSERAPYEVLATPWLSYQSIINLKRVEEVLEVYYNSGQFAHTMKYLERYFSSAFEMYEQLGTFYQKKHPKGEKHSRITRYDILLEFFQTVKNREKSCNSGETAGIPAFTATSNVDKAFRERLTYDFYLRENAKARPDFALDITSYKKRVQKFYRSCHVRELLPDYEAYDSRQIEKMTHIEIFGIGSGKETYILFDYRNRSALDHQAETIEITDRIREEK